MKERKTPIIILTGPTGVGKTEIAIRLAQELQTEIINADSMQIYRYMDIGTAKPTPQQRRLVRHHLIDIRNPDEDYDAAQFVTDADLVIGKLANQNKIPLVVGGTMLYLRALVHGLFPSPPKDKALREELKNIAAQKGISYLFEQLKEIDPQAAAKIAPTDLVRIIRAIEVFKLTGKPISWHQRQHQFQEKRYPFIQICLYLPREMLYERINRRVDKMLNMGLVDEVKQLLNMGYSPQLKSMQAIGYRHIISYLEGKCSLEQAKEWLKRDTRHYAKRQLSWWRGEKEVIWISPQELKKLKDVVKNWLDKRH